MTIRISNPFIAADAPHGTVVGTLSESRFNAVSYSFLLSNQSLFGFSATNKIITLWTTPTTPKSYRLYLMARGHGFFQYDLGSIMITVTAATNEPTKFSLNFSKEESNPQPPPHKPGP